MTRRALLLIGLLWLSPAWAGTPQEALAAAVKDCEKLPPDTRLFARYLWLPPQAAKDRDTFLRVLAFQLNSISREADLARPAQVNANLLRVDIRDYGWSREVFEKLKDVEPYFHVKLQATAVAAVAVGDTVRTVRGCNVYRGADAQSVRGQVESGLELSVVGLADQMVQVDSSVGHIWISLQDVTRVGGAVVQAGSIAAAPWLDAKKISRLILLTQSQVPLVNAQWFFAQTARQVDRNDKQVVGYYDFLGLKNQKDAEELAGLDRAKARKIQREIAAIVVDSGVALHNRQIYRFGTVAGSWWETLDVESNIDARNAIRQLNGDFKADAHEVYFSLPNNLWGLLALNNKGELQATVPDKIASDNQSTSNDHRIHSGFSCIRCHVEGLRPFDDWGRKFYANPPGDAKLTSPDYAKLQRLKRLYLGPIDDVFNADQAVYARTLKRLTGYTPAELAKAYAAVWQDYAEKSVTGERFAAELGVTKEEMVAAFKKYAVGQGTLDPTLLSFLKTPEIPIRREYAEESFGLAQLVLKGVRP